MSNGRSERKAANWEGPAIFIFGVVFVLLLVVLAIFFPNPTPFQYVIFKTVLALAAAGVGALIPGLLHVDIPAVRAGGALAIFVLVYQFSPASLVVDAKSTPPQVQPPTPAPAKEPTQSQPPPVTTIYRVCTGEYERACNPHDVYLYCYVDINGWAKPRCESYTLQRLDSKGGNKCGYDLVQVLCKNPK
jgi:hypothetical protein